MELGFYPRYDRLGASSRLRFFAYFDRWGKQSGETLRMHPGLSDGYLRKLYQKGRVSLLRKLGEELHLFRRAFALERNLLLEYELLPDVPWSVEKRFLAKRRYILNFDDFVWAYYQGKPGLEHKFDDLCRHASGVIVANEFLREKVAPLCSNVILIPTTIDLDAYRAPDAPKFERFTVAWIGTPITYPYLEQNLAALQAMREAADFELLVIARKELEKRPLPGISVRYIDWSPECEAELLARAHVGIMPLVPDAMAQGKSAYKLIQYQAAGLPAIASPIGENCRVIEEGANGFLADSPEAWGRALKQLFEDKALYDKMATEARRRAYDFSIQKYLPIFQEFVRRTFQR